MNEQISQFPVRGYTMTVMKLYYRLQDAHKCNCLLLRFL